MPINVPTNSSWRPFNVLFLLFALVLLGALVGSTLGQLAARAYGVSDLTALLSRGEGVLSLAERNALRLFNLIGHIFTFAVPALLTAWIIYRERWAEALKLTQAPGTLLSLAGVLLLLVSFPLIEMIYWFNQQIPLPDWMKTMEDSQNAVLKDMIRMESAGELLLTLLTAAVVPAIGEELLFRGVFQQQLMRWNSSGNMAVWLTALLFSTIHLQFEGFLPRLLLGAALGYLLLWTGRLWVPILGHFVFNGLQVLGVYWLGVDMAEVDPTTQANPKWYLVLPSLIIFGLLLRWLHNFYQSEKAGGADWDETSTP